MRCASLLWLRVRSHCSGALSIYCLVSVCDLKVLEYLAESHIPKWLLQFAQNLVDCGVELKVVIFTGESKV